MKRTKYKGYIIDTDNLGRPYIYNTSSPYSEDADHILIYIDPTRQLDQAKAIINDRISTGQDTRHAMINPADGKIVLM